MHYLLFYDYVEDYVAQRAPLRAAHLKLARESHERGEMVLGGAYAEPDHGGVLVFRGESPTAAENFAKADPYVLHGVVTRWEVKRWLTVIGDGATMPPL
ncbi:MAG: YciI-like protein [Candidatus Acidiferrales bacterium]|jgi:uncharacterized protein YciI